MARTGGKARAGIKGHTEGIIVISDGLALGSALGGIGSGIMTNGTIRYRAMIGMCSSVGAFACSGLVIRAYEWPREFDVEMGVSFLLGIVGIAALNKLLDEIKGFSFSETLGKFFKRKE